MLYMPVALKIFAPLAAVLTVFTTLAHSSEVMLKYNTGGLTIGGQLLDFDGDDYVVENEALGTVRVKANLFRCLGAGCPAGPLLPREAADANAQTVRIAGSNAAGGRLMPQLIGDYASTLGAFVIPKGS